MMLDASTLRSLPKQCSAAWQVVQSLLPHLLLLRLALDTNACHPFRLPAVPVSRRLFSAVIVTC